MRTARTVGQATTAQLMARRRRSSRSALPATIVLSAPLKLTGQRDLAAMHLKEQQKNGLALLEPTVTQPAPRLALLVQPATIVVRLA